MKKSLQISLFGEVKKVNLCQACRKRKLHLSAVWLERVEWEVDGILRIKKYFIRFVQKLKMLWRFLKIFPLFSPHKKSFLPNYEELMTTLVAELFYILTPRRNSFVSSSTNMTHMSSRCFWTWKIVLINWSSERLNHCLGASYSCFIPTVHLTKYQTATKSHNSISLKVCARRQYNKRRSYSRRWHIA